MSNNKNRDEKQPGENPEGKFHYNPGNMAGKTPAIPEVKIDPEAPPAKAK